MATTTWPRIAWFASRIVLLAALAFGLVYLAVAFTRLAYPYDIDFIEDGLLMQARRVANGAPVFLPPNAEFVPHVYTPLYTWLGGLLFRVTEPGFAPLRLISLAATLMTAALIYGVARRECRRGWLGLACAGLFAAGYALTGGWYELARVDALFTTLSLAGLALIAYRHDARRDLVIGGIVLGLSVLAKQNGAVFVLAAGLYLILVVGRRAGWFAIAAAATALVPFALLHVASDGWSSYYFFGVAYASPLEAQRILAAVRYEWFGSTAVLAAGYCLWAGLWIARARLQALRQQPWLLFIATAVLISLAGRASVGGSLNNWIVGYAFLCLSPALCLRDAGDSPRAEAAIGVALLLQFGLCLYNTMRFVPTAAMRDSGDRLIARLAAIDGDVLVMMHPFYAVRAGRPESAQIAALWHARWRGRDPLPEDFRRQIESRRYAAIISDESMYFETDPALIELIEANYVRAEEWSASDAPPTLTGMVVRPQAVYVPRAGLP